jgi:transposase
MRSARGHADIVMRSWCFPSKLTDAQWALMRPHIASAKFGGRPCTTDVRTVLDAIIYLFPPVASAASFPATSRPGRPYTAASEAGVCLVFGALLHRALHPLACLAAGRKPDPTVVIMDGQSVKTAEQGGPAVATAHRSTAIAVWDYAERQVAKSQFRPRGGRQHSA